MTRSSIRRTKSGAFSTTMKCTTRATLHRDSQSEEANPDVLEGLTKPKADSNKKLGKSRSSSVFSGQEKNLAPLSDDEGFGSPTILPAVPPIIARPHQRLTQVALFVNAMLHLHKGMESLVQQGSKPEDLGRKPEGIREGVFLADFSQMLVGGVADSQTRSKPLKYPPNCPENRLFRPKFHLSFSQILQKPWGGWVGKHIWERSSKKAGFFYTFPRNMETSL